MSQRGLNAMSSARIQLHLDIHEPIELVEMTLSFQALAMEHRKHLNKQVRAKGGKASDDIKLYITKIENNCILAELGSASDILGALFPTLDSLKKTRVRSVFSNMKRFCNKDQQRQFAGQLVNC